MGAVADTTSNDLLPSTLERNDVSQRPIASRDWTIPDIVEVTRITGIAVQGATRNVAFILQQPSIARGDDEYGLYVVSADKPGPARKVLDATYLTDLQWRPGTATWTFRGDLGAGVQLYQIDSAGHSRSLVSNLQLARVGGYDGLVASSKNKPRATGVLSYEWSPDGSKLWYSTLRLLFPAERQAFEDKGVVFQDATMYPFVFKDPPAASAVELHLFDPNAKTDRTLVTLPGDRSTAQFAFQKQEGFIGWTDRHHIAYRLFTYNADGVRSASQWLVDVDTGHAQEAPTSGRPFFENFDVVSTPKGNLVVRKEGAGQKLLMLTHDGTVAKDYGPVPYTRLDSAYWHDEKSGRSILSVHYPDHDGLAPMPGSPGAALLKIGDQLSHCAFNADVSFGVCNRETVNSAPELVAITPATGNLTVLARPNSRYDQIRPLHTVHAQWTNRFGAVNDGYITYPRNYQAGHRYPALIVTHGFDAQNRFLCDDFQWEYPIQLFAERGYFVLSVNEPQFDAAVMNAWGTGSGNVTVSKMQFSVGYNPIASMEAAVQSLIDKGQVDPAAVGMAGYSAGGILTTLTMSHSKLFHAGANGDTNFFSAGGFWGGAMERALYTTLFGGSPFDPKAYENYRAFSPSARAEHFAGPLLQQFAAEDASWGLELDQVLRDKHVPTELAFYRDETHIFYNPRRRASAMELSFDWFDYWLSNRRDPDSSKVEQYHRWDAMAKQWHAPQKAESVSTP